MLLTDNQIDLLLNQQAITDEWPWSTNDEHVVDKNIRDIVAEIRRKVRVDDRTEYGHYGSGYASFVDCWLYRSNDDFRYDPGDSYMGLVVLFSRLSPFYVIGQGHKAWEESSGVSYMPDFNFVDRIEHQAVTKLVPHITVVLADRGLMRLQKADLATLLHPDIVVPTVLAERVFRYFDALFYWED